MKRDKTTQSCSVPDRLLRLVRAICFWRKRRNLLEEYIEWTNREDIRQEFLRRAQEKGSRSLQVFTDKVKANDQS